MQFKVEHAGYFQVHIENQSKRWTSDVNNKPWSGFIIQVPFESPYIYECYGICLHFKMANKLHFFFMSLLRFIFNSSLI